MPRPKKKEYVVYVCPRCKKEFKKRWSYDYHKNRKFPCKEMIRNDEGQLVLSEEVCKFRCEFCGKDVSENRSKLTVHINL